LGTFYDYATVKYNSSGTQQWVSRYNGPGTSDDYANAIAVDASGNVFVTGEAFFAPNEGSDYATIKYSPSGAQQWVARYNGPASSVDVANDIVVDGSGNVYVTGESRGPATEDDFATIKYNSSGIEQCLVRYNGPGNTFDLASALAVDASGNIYVTGRSANTGFSTISTIKYVMVTVSVNGQNTETPREFSLKQNYPNPFNPSTVINYSVPKSAFVTIKIYDLTGREVKTLVSSQHQTGNYTESFVASGMASGIYYYTMTADDPSADGQIYIETRKMILVK
jgi:hypothetical protein